MVATPIGNLGDLSPRAQAVLAGVDLIAAEDTRVTGQLLQAFGIKTRMISVREHNERQAAAQIVERLAAGLAVAQVSDAGTPAVSDPGARLVDAVLAAGHKVCPIPGPSAVVAAVSACGIEGEGFRFVGFLPPKTKARREALEALSRERGIVVCYEAPHRLLETLADMGAVLGPDRVVALARELTKTFETLRRAPVSELLTWAEREQQARGECVLLIAPASEPESASLTEAGRVLDLLLEELSPSLAARLAARITGVRRQDLYALALKRRGDDEEEDDEDEDEDEEGDETFPDRS